MDRNTLIIKDIYNERGGVCINFVITDSLKSYFNENVFYYSWMNENRLPHSIAVIPFICNILPIIWLTDTVLLVNELDETFGRCINSLRDSYARMYPMLEFKGEIKYKPIKNVYHTGEKSICLFSGGLDACTTVTRHINENMILLSIRGSADYPLNDERGWKIHYKELMTLAKSFNKPVEILSSNFYSFIDNWGALNSLIEKSKETWWHGFQHGIGLISLAIPYAYINGCNRIYIASSYDQSSENITCASHPSIDEKLKFGNCNVVHDGFELTRQNKMTIVNDTWGGKGLKMHVCLRQYEIENCCKCEKCYRTILAILAEGGDPNLYGFKYRYGDEKKIIKNLKHRINVTYVNYYADIQKRIIENKDNIKSKELLKFASFNINKINATIYKRIRKNIEKSWIHFLIIKIKGQSERVTIE